MQELILLPNDSPVRWGSVIDQYLLRPLHSLEFREQIAVNLIIKMKPSIIAATAIQGCSQFKYPNVSLNINKYI